MLYSNIASCFISMYVASNCIDVTKKVQKRIKPIRKRSTNRCNTNLIKLLCLPNV